MYWSYSWWKTREPGKEKGRDIVALDNKRRILILIPTLSQALLPQGVGISPVSALVVLCTQNSNAPKGDSDWSSLGHMNTFWLNLDRALQQYWLTTKLWLKVWLYKKLKIYFNSEKFEEWVFKITHLDHK